MRNTTLRHTAAVLAIALIGANVGAEVSDSGANGFTIKRSVTVAADPAKAYTSLVAVASWWESAHTFSGDAKNLSIDARPGGCFCERLPEGGVQHLVVVYAAPGKTLRLAGGLGPLQSLAAAGSMTFALSPADSGTRVDFTYAVGGYKSGGFADLAPIVDSVLGTQLERYKRFVDTGKP